MTTNYLLLPSLFEYKFGSKANNIYIGLIIDSMNETTDESNIFNGITLGELYQYRIKCIDYQNTNNISVKPKTTYKLIGAEKTKSS